MAEKEHEALTVDELIVPPGLLVPGENLIAIQGLNVSLTSSDFSLIPEARGILSPDVEVDRSRFDAFFAAAGSGNAGAPARLEYLEGRLHQRAGRLEEALGSYEKALSFKPDDPWPLYRLAECLRALGKGAEALERLRRDLRAGARANRKLLDLFIEAHREAGRGWEEILEAWPERASSYEWVLAPTGEKQAAEWRFSVEEPGKGWQEPGFDDSRWQKGPGGFGRQASPDAALRTAWITPHIWLRRQFDAGASFFDRGAKSQPRFRIQLRLRIKHDDDAEVYLNGQEIARLPSWSHNAYILKPIDDPRLLKPGANLLAVHCENKNADQIIDAGLVLILEPYE
jgi:tetratricopeptide (TPR) repeat protein